MSYPGKASYMDPKKAPGSELIYRCAGPNCSVLKGSSDKWWLMWAAQVEGMTVLSLCAWDDEIANREAALYVCGENCAQKLQSQFMTNILAHKAEVHH
jgi:hypothetical protein